MRKSIAIGSMVLALASCKKDKAEDKAAPEGDVVAGKVNGTAKPADAAPSRYEGVTPLAMPAAIALTPEETAQVEAIAKQAGSGMVQYGVPRGGFPDDADAALLANPKLLLALMQRPEREVQVAAGQAIFNLQAFGATPLVPPPEYRAIVSALMTSKDEVIAASVTQSAHGGIRGENADPEIQALLQRLCTDDARVSVRAAACSGVVDHLNAHFGEVADAQAVAAKAITDDSDYVIYRTLEIVASMTWDSQYLATLLPLLAHEEPAIRGKAAQIVERTIVHDHQPEPGAVTKGHDALVPLLADADPFVRCAALNGLSNWNFRDRWAEVETMIPLMDDTGVPETKLAYQAVWLDGPKDDTWTVSGSRATVGECAITALIAKAGTASGDAALQFSDWQNVATAGRQAFTDWWASHKAALLAAKPG